MVHQIGMGYGIWESLVHLAGNQLGGHEKVWVIGGYGLSQVWVKTETTVFHVCQEIELLPGTLGIISITFQFSFST